MSLDNNSANNFKDFLDAIKPYLNYQPVDLSCMGIDAFQFSTDEKPVGQYTDANGVTKLLYQKIVRSITIPSSTGVHNAYTETGAEFFRVVELFSDATTKMQLNYIPLRSMTYGITFFTEDNVLKIVTESDRSGFNPFMAIVQYTKTTDSPLSSDEKFAGVTSGGEVIYEKHISLTNKSLPNDADVNCGTLSGYSKVSVFADVNSNGTHFNNGRWVGAYVDNNGTIYVSQIFSSQTATCDIELTIRYTKTP